jgi:hypothetical protein
MRGLFFFTITILLLRCTDERGQLNEKRIDKADSIFNDFLMANMVATTEGKNATSTLHYYLTENDTIEIDEGAIGLSFFGSDSLRGTYKVVDSTNYLVFSYQTRHSYIFKVYDKKNNKLIDKAGVGKIGFFNIMFPGNDPEKIRFHDTYLNAIEVGYERIGKKYSIPRKYIDSLISSRMRPYELESSVMSDTLVTK